MIIEIDVFHQLRPAQDQICFEFKENGPHVMFEFSRHAV